MKNKDAIIAKQKELISKLNKLCKYCHDSVVLGEDADYEELIDHKLTKIKQLESELSALESEPAALESEAEERKTAEALLDNHKELFGDRWYFTEYLVSLMELYASQSLPEISDEEIDNKRFTSLGIIGTEDIVNAEIDGFKRGAKWYRDELKRRLK